MAKIQEKTITSSSSISPLLFQIYLLFSTIHTTIAATIHDPESNLHFLDHNDYLRHEIHGAEAAAAAAAEEEYWGVVERKGNQFVVNGGQPFYVNGFNTYWLMTLAVDQSTRQKVSDVFRQAASVGLSVCRTWGFSDGGWRALQKSPSVYNEDVFKALDFVVSEARKYKIRLVLPLVNNWQGFGGKAQYVTWGNAAGLNLTSEDDFFSDPTVKSYYKAHVKIVLNRVNTFTNITYKDDATIFAWELMNELECPSDPSGDKLQAWIQEMAIYLKSIDPVHLLSTGSEGFYGPSTPDRLQVNPNQYAGRVGADFIRNHQALGIDYASVHLYPDSRPSASDDLKLQFAETWMENHTADGDSVLGMPVLLGEFGVSVHKNSTFRDKFIKTVYRRVLDVARRGGSAGGCLLWEIFPEGTDYMDEDGYAVVLTQSPTTANILALQSRRINNFNSKCSWKCRWGCRKRSSSEDSMFMPHHEL